MLGLPKGIVQISQYDASWPRLYAQEASRIRAAMGRLLLDIQHVGSTSIPGMQAKPIIDIAIAVSSFEESVVCVPDVEALGYTYRGEYGIPRRHYFVKGNPRTHHLHIVENGSREWQTHLLFRNTLRADATLLRRYAELKQRLAREFSKDRQAYQDGKREFISEVITQVRGT